jgi:hypothetical protein
LIIIVPEERLLIGNNPDKGCGLIKDASGIALIM